MHAGLYERDWSPHILFRQLTQTGKLINPKKNLLIGKSVLNLLRVTCFPGRWRHHGCSFHVLEWRRRVVTNGRPRPSGKFFVLQAGRPVAHTRRLMDHRRATPLNSARITTSRRWHRRHCCRCDMATPPLILYYKPAASFFFYGHPTVRLVTTRRRKTSWVDQTFNNGKTAT